jgi:hypothetical protein
MDTAFKNKDARTKQVDFGMVLKVLNLSRKTLRVRNVVAVHPPELLA